MLIALGIFLILIGGFLMQLMNPPSRTGPPLFIGGCFVLVIGIIQLFASFA